MRTAVLGACLFLMLPAVAQDIDRPVNITGAAVQPAGPRFPESFAWDPEARGALLIVLPLEEKDGQRVACGSITAFAPKTMSVLRWERLPEPQLFAELGTGEKWELFLASLTDDQWKLLGGAGGIGYGDLDKDQKKLFQALLPDPMTVQKAGQGAVTLTSSQRTNTRLRLSRRFHYAFVDSEKRQIGAPRLGGTAGVAGEGGSGFRLAEPASAHPPQIVTFTRAVSGVALASPTSDQTVEIQLAQPTITMRAEALKIDTFNALGSQIFFTGIDSSFRSVRSRPRSNFGATLTQATPNHLKQGDLSFTSPALDRSVPLDGVRTVRELVQRVAEVTKLELFCDPRYAPRPVHLRGKSARAGDILKALCWSVTGTFRRVGTGYVLTDELVPLAIRLGKIADWREAAQKRLDTLREKGEPQRAEREAKFIDWGENSPVGTTPSVRERLAQNTGERIPLSTLPASLQEQLRAAMDAWHNAPNGDPNRAPLDRTAIVNQSELQLELLIPEIGTVPANWGGGFPRRKGEEAKAEAVPLPAGGPARSIALRVKSRDEATQAIQAVKAAGLNRLWLAVGVDDTALLAGAIADGKAAGVEVAALVAPLRVPAQMERTVEGKRSETYQRPDLLESQAQVLPALKKLVTLPGLAALALTDLYPTGYRGDEDDWKQILGYTEPLRLACLRANGADPVDLSDNGLSGPRSIPILSDLPTVGRLFVFESFSSTSTNANRSGNSAFWNTAGPLWEPFHQVRREAVERFVSGLLETLRKDTVIPLLRVTRNDQALVPGEKVEPTALQRVMLPNSTKGFEWFEVRNRILQAGQQKATGIVFDATDRPLAQALSLLARLQNP